MKRIAACALCIAVIACAADDVSRQPRDEDIAKVEAKLSTHPCIGPLDLWERNFRYGVSKRYFWPQSNHTDLDVIEFHLRRAGTVVIAPGRSVFGIQNEGWPESSSIRSIDGSFVISTGRLSLGRCKPQVRAQSS